SVWQSLRARKFARASALQLRVPRWTSEMKMARCHWTERLGARAGGFGKGRSGRRDAGSFSALRKLLNSNQAPIRSSPESRSNQRFADARPACSTAVSGVLQGDVGTVAAQRIFCDSAPGSRVDATYFALHNDYAPCAGAGQNSA